MTSPRTTAFPGHLPRSAASRVRAVGGYRPERVATNPTVAASAGVTPEWITRRVGVEERRYADSTESVVDMAVEASRRTLTTAQLDPSAVSVLILATCSMPSPMPNGAASVAARLGATAAAAFDINTACSGFNHALALADALVRAGTAQQVLVVASERMTDWVDPTDRSTGPIFADGAAAALVSPSDTPGIFPVAWGHDGSQADAIQIPDRYSKMTMQGRTVYRWTVTALPAIARHACHLAGLDPSQIKGFVPHQANLRIIDALADSADITCAANARDITRTGNTCAASVPLALCNLIETGQLASGDPVLLFGFGAGLSYAAQVITCP
jgi:3-oxoacyl-[acyl-carrier-protein] synthase-3